MKSEMVIELDWLPPFQGRVEVQRTSATIEIRCGTENATRFEDAWSKSVQHGARLSAYPLALWFASSWWRIRWEPLPSRIRLLPEGLRAPVDWRLNHEVAAARYGFIWPPITFASDGEAILVSCRRSGGESTEPVRYLSEFDIFVAASDFERAIDEFMDLVLRRLDNLGRTELHVLWSEVLAERADSTQSAARRFEARLGYDPDEASAGLIQQLLDVASEVGADAADEIAPVCSGANPAETLDEVMTLASRPGVIGKIPSSLEKFSENGTKAPWQRGRHLADHVRESLGLGRQPLDDRSLADLLQISSDHLTAPERADSAPLGLAIRTEKRSELKLLFRKRNRPGRRFEAARFIADYLCSRDDRWFPITDAVTARQKVQRAFAAEFLCPIESLRSYLGNEFLPEAFEDAAAHFGISEVAVKSHLANHQLIPRIFVDSPTLLDQAL